ncbi:MAG TPA: trehalose-6-phosphate synthase [Thermoanaerobaculia bacterium]|nr:trehalose-6-phosphate synthase [Thermoanaerobaculia bacterium]
MSTRITKHESRRPGGAVSESLVLGLGAVGIVVLLLGIVVMLDRSIQRWTARELERRTMLVLRAVDGEGHELAPDQLQRRLDRLAEDDRVVALVVCRSDESMISSGRLRSVFSCRAPLVTAALAAEGTTIITSHAGNDIQMTARRFGPGLREILLVIQDRSFLRDRRIDIIQAAAVAGGLGLLVLVVALHYGIRSTRARLLHGIRELFQPGRDRRSVPRALRPLLDDLNDTVRRLRAQRPREGESSGPERLRELVSDRIPDASLVLVANREPYIHSKSDSGVRVERPASGLVTGVEPLLKACGGVWIAMGGGSADRETADEKGRLAVPPDAPEYILRRLFLSRLEEEGFYYGFANEGLWPLCHIAHTRPTFRESDWNYYGKVNRRFAEVAVEEAGPTGLILAQDYHFALFPMEVRRLAPDSVISLFWHIPWPNDEVMGICPWNRELLDGMLGADVLGFHTRYHCLNFLDTVQRYLECRVDLEEMSVEYQQRKTLIRAYPISVDWPYKSAPPEEGVRLRSELGVPSDALVALGVDRADYTKGLLERIAAVEYLLERNPELVGRFVFVQLAAPSRTHIKRYRDLVSEIEDEVVRVNRRFGRNGYEPIIYELKSYSPWEVKRHYAMADIALVTPLHDGMNLVSKEFVASRVDGRGVLVLSAFAGAAKELEGALVVNPYDAADVARAILRGIEMPEDEERARMEAMRAAIEKNTIYDWSAGLLADMAEIWDRRNRGWTREAEAR